MKAMHIVIFFASLFLSVTFAQDITGTLGSGGKFIVKDANKTYLEVNSSDGLLNLSNGLTIPILTNSTTGVIFKGTNRFIHTYAPGGAIGNNTFAGIESGNFTMSGSGVQSSFNTGFGSGSLKGLTSGSNNAGFGDATLGSNTTGEGNSAFGSQSLRTNTIGGYNSAFGNAALESNTTGNFNSSFGFTALQNNSEGSSNSAFGYESMRLNSTGYNNTAFGTQTLRANTTGHSNSAFGITSLAFNQTGFFNSAFGMNALRNNTSGEENSAFGQAALFANTNGYSNSAFGTGALQGNTSGFSNTAIGYNAGNSVTTGSNLTLIGFGAQPTSPSAINQITLGNGLVTSIRANVTSITSLSDARDKKNVKELSLGLDFLMKVKTREFNWDKREWYEDGNANGSRMENKPTAGFIAQELDNLQSEADAGWLNLVLKENPERLEASAGNLFPVIVKAVQDLKIEKDSEIAQLKTDNALLKKELESLKEMQIRLVKLEQVLMSYDVKFSSNTND